MAGRKLKIWNGSLDGIDHLFVAAVSQKRALELLREVPGGRWISLYYFRGWWHCCGNDKMWTTVKEGGDTEGVWKELKPWSGEYKKITGAKNNA